MPFLFRAFGRKKVIFAFVRLAPEVAKIVIGFSDRDTFKEALIRTLFEGESVPRLKEIGREHAKAIIRWVRPEALRRISWHRSRGDRIVMISASLDLYLEFVAAELGFDDLACTRPSVANAKFSGGLQGRNCRGPEKVRRLQELVGSLEDCEIYAYGDSAGDRELLEVADRSF